MAVWRERTKNTQRPSLFTRLMLRFSASRRIDGLWVGSFESHPEPSLRRVEQALNLIKTHDPCRYRRLIRDLERIWVLITAEGRAAFDEGIWACVLDPRYVLDAANSVEELAASIVHEATHARLQRCGIKYQQDLRARIEAICFRQQRAFGAMIPNGEQISKEANFRLSAYGTPQYWTNQAFRIRDNAGVRAALEHLEVPNWLIRVLLTVRSLGALFRHRDSSAGF
jgi:hypothetical protein